jgi:hypothetical protein
MIMIIILRLEAKKRARLMGPGLRGEVLVLRVGLVG